MFVDLGGDAAIASRSYLFGNTDGPVWRRSALSARVATTRGGGRSGIEKCEKAHKCSKLTQYNQWETCKMQCNSDVTRRSCRLTKRPDLQL
ncbi:hypothetical protein PAXRUDRAFT_827912 [Paxillus rubicundulus Ve08.2h10]|uniref:Uncharacterized protein n=1 Tax=Paxillus rubicundulus Ve08.2h10 TaxID=930991 RepID=A0A0D0DX13_9AGAM|nr:hypothetical protein PAXRUDRAFT_827912 [Paxillus rubicundulus Ve08.2h10]